MQLETILIEFYIVISKLIGIFIQNPDALSIPD